jgi:hypothetical protein
LTLRKKANDLARLNLIRRDAHRFLGASWSDGDASGCFQNRMEKAVFVVALIDDVMNATRTRQLQNNGIDERNVIGQQKETSGGKIFAAES